MLPNTFNSYRLANVINTKYPTIKITPNFLSSFQPFQCVARISITTVDSSEMVEYVSPV